MDASVGNANVKNAQRGTSVVAAANITLLAALLALAALAAVGLTAKPAEAGHGYLSAGP